MPRPIYLSEGSISKLTDGVRSLLKDALANRSISTISVVVDDQVETRTSPPRPTSRPPADDVTITLRVTESGRSSKDS